MDVSTLDSKLTNRELSQLSFRLWLQQKFTDRCKKNQNYSLRSFAKALSIDASSLSQIMAGKRSASEPLMNRLCSSLSATPQDLRRFGLLELSSSENDFYQVQLDTFSVISDWYHYAILELTFVSDFQSDPKWIAKKLVISVNEAKTAIERLKRLNLLKVVDGKLVKSNQFITNKSVLDTSSAHREFQRQVIQKALTAIDECPQDKKDITSMTMAIDVNHLPKAKEIIKNFRRDLSKLLESGQTTEVYNLAIQLYPLSLTKETL